MVLDDIYKSYLQCANLITGWQNENKNDLIIKYCKLKEKNDPYADCYMAAIMCKYWPKLWRFKQKTPVGCTEEDVYDWLTQAIIGTLAFDPLPWENPNSSLFGDPNGPDKCINIQMASRRASHLVFINRKKRAGDVFASSLDELSENYGDMINFDSEIIDSIIDESHDSLLQHKSILQDFILKQKFYLFFVYFYIITHGCTGPENIFSEKTLVKLLMNTTVDDLNYIAEYTEIPYKDILYAYSCSILGQPNHVVSKFVKSSMYQLKKLYFEGSI